MVCSNCKNISDRVKNKQINSLDDSAEFFENATNEKLRQNHENYVANLGYCIDSLKILYQKGEIESVEGLPKIKENICSYDRIKLENLYVDLKERYFPEFNDVGETADCSKFMEKYSIE